MRFCALYGRPSLVCKGANEASSTFSANRQNSLRFVQRRSLIASVALLGTACVVPSIAYAQYVETESNNDKTTANVLNLGTATSATISGTSANNSFAEYDYFRINTNYTTAGIYRNQLQLNNNGTQNIGRIRGLSQSAGVINAGTSTPFQTSPSNSTPMPYGFNQYYSFGGAGKTQSVYYEVNGVGNATGGAYTTTFTSTLVTPTNIGSIGQGDITFSALANIGSSGVATNTSIVVLDSNYNVYYDNVPSSATFGYAASNDSASAGFALKRRFDPGTYYIAVGIGVLATNQAAAPDEVAASKNNQVLDFGNVIATNSSFYNGNNGNTRPSDFTIANSYGNTVYTSSGQVIPSLDAVNFYRFTVFPTPEPSSFALAAVSLLTTAAFLRRRARRV